MNPFRYWEPISHEDIVEEPISQQDIEDDEESDRFFSPNHSPTKKSDSPHLDFSNVNLKRRKL